MLDRKLLRALICAYPLDKVEQIEQIHNGNNRVYRLRCRAPAPYDTIAVKISKLSSERSIAGKRVEKVILDNLYHDLAFPFVPRLLTPTAEFNPAQSQPWGLLWNAPAAARRSPHRFQIRLRRRNRLGWRVGRAAQ